MRQLCAAVSMMVAATAGAQTFVNADAVKAEPIVSRDQTGYKACGVRVVTARTAPGADSVAYDFTISITDSAEGKMNAGQSLVRFDQTKSWNIDTLRIKQPAPDAFWLAKRDDKMMFKPGKFVPSDHPGFVVGNASVQIAAALMLAIVQGEPMQVAMHTPGDQSERIMGFRVELNDELDETVQGCLFRLAERMPNEPPPPTKQ